MNRLLTEMLCRVWGGPGLVLLVCKMTPSMGNGFPQKRPSTLDIGSPIPDVRQGATKADLHDAQRLRCLHKVAGQDWPELREAALMAGNPAQVRAIEWSTNSPDGGHDVPIRWLRPVNRHSLLHNHVGLVWNAARRCYRQFAAIQRPETGRKEVPVPVTRGSRRDGRVDRCLAAFCPRAFVTARRPRWRGRRRPGHRAGARLSVAARPRRCAS